MKKIFSILAAAVIAFSFSSCEKGNSVEMNGFKITVDSITSTGAFISVEPADSTVIYAYGIASAEELKGQNADSIAASIQDYYGAYYTFEQLVQYGLFVQGPASDSWAGYLDPNTDYAAYAFAIEEDSLGNWVAPKGWAVKYFRTKPLTPKETVALDSLAGKATLYPDSLTNDFQILVSNSTYEVAITLTEIAGAEGNFTEKDFYTNSYSVYNYVAWGEGDDDWTELATLSIRGSLNANNDKYTFSGSAIGKNEVKYTFDNVTVDYAVYDGTNGAPAKAPARKGAAKKELKKDE